MLLTGATGFLGSRLLRALLSVGIRVIVVKRSWSDTWRISEILSRALVYDLDRVDLQEIFAQHTPDFIVHAATCYGRNGESPEEIEEANYCFPLALLQLGKRYRVDTVFNFDTFFNSKTELPDGLGVYVLSKKRFVASARKWAEESPSRFVNMRLEHIYGPNDDEKKFIPFLVRSLLENRAVLDLTAGEQQRDFIYVDDVAAALIVLLGRSGELAEPYIEVGIGTGQTCTLRHLVDVARIISASATETRFGSLPYRQDEIMFSRADTSLLKALGWVPQVALDEGVKRTVDEMRSRKARLGTS